MKVLAFPPRHILKPDDADDADNHAQLDAAIITLTESLSIREKIELIAALSEE